jgi:hypothetical protein
VANSAADKPRFPLGRPARDTNLTARGRARTGTGDKKSRSSGLF